MMSREVEVARGPRPAPVRSPPPSPQASPALPVRLPVLDFSRRALLAFCGDSTSMESDHAKSKDILSPGAGALSAHETCRLLREPGAGPQQDVAKRFQL